MNRLKQMISAIGIALILFSAAAEKAAALPLTETIYMIPEYSVELLLRGTLEEGVVEKHSGQAGLPLLRGSDGERRQCSDAPDKRGHKQARQHVRRQRMAEHLQGWG